jgi:hypothetical protein
MLEPTNSEYRYAVSRCNQIFHNTNAVMEALEEYADTDSPMGEVYAEMRLIMDSVIRARQTIYNA